MKKKLLVFALIAVMALSFTACGGSDDSNDTKETTTAKVETTYQTILDEYSQKIKDATPGLVEEYNSEASGITDVNQLAQISTEKVTKLAEISNDGITQMAKLMTKNGDSQEAYQEWATKLQDVYTENAKQITDAYTNSALQ